MPKKAFKMPKLKTSVKRATGITKAKRNIAKITGIPTTKSGIKRKESTILGMQPKRKSGLGIIKKLFSIK